MERATGASAYLTHGPVLPLLAQAVVVDLKVPKLPLLAGWPGL